MTLSRYSEVESPVGPLTLRWAQRSLVGVYFAGAPKVDRHRHEWIRDDACLAPVRAQLDEYFRGARSSFDLPLDFEGTPFQKRVWRALCEIPSGQFVSYGELARRVGTVCARAVGAANGQNPIAIVVPCHRVIGADGSLTGFAGGLPRKRWLLEHEGARGRWSSPTQMSFG